MVEGGGGGGWLDMLANAGSSSNCGRGMADELCGGEERDSSHRFKADPKKQSWVAPVKPNSDSPACIKH